MKRTFLYIILIVLISLSVGLLKLAYKHDDLIDLKIYLQKKFEKDVYSQYKSNESLTELRTLFIDIEDEGIRIDSVRNFVNKHSIHNESTERHKAYAFNPSTVIEGLLKTSKQGDTIGIMHLSCTPRAFAMRNILNAIEQKNRIVMLYFHSDQNLLSHTFLEVYNSITAKWEVQDPDMNVSYIRKGDSTYSLLSLKEMRAIVERGDLIEPIYDGKEASIWLNLNSPAQLAIHSQVFLKEDYKKDLIFIDSRFIDMGYRYPDLGNKTIIEFFRSKGNGKTIIEW
jgi:hypothetical protein